jgi:4-hydroxybenzoyl-CoA thioesterase
MRHIISRAAEILVEGQEVRIFARRRPDDPLRIQAVRLPDHLRKLIE